MASAAGNVGKVYTHLYASIFLQTGAEGHPIFTFSLFFQTGLVFGVLCFTDFSFCSPDPILSGSSNDVFVAVQNANTPVPWIDGAGRNPPLSPPQPPPPQLCAFTPINSYIQVFTL